MFTIHHMLRRLLLVVLLSLPVAVQAENLDSLLQVLDQCLQQRDVYEKKQVAKAKLLKTQAEQAKNSSEALRALDALSRQEQARHSDEALTACEKAFTLAYRMGNYDMAARMALRKALVLGMSGFPWEARSLLDAAISDPVLRPYLLKADYYTTYYNIFDFYHAYSLPATLINRNYAYLQTLEDSIRQQQSDPAKLAMTFCYSSRKVSDMIVALKHRLNEVPEEAKGVVANTIANKYYLINDLALRDYYLALAAIYNVRCGRHENEALIRLADRMTELGDWYHAALYTRVACEDAVLYNSRSRMLELYPILTEVSQHFEEKSARQTRWLLWGGIGTGLVVALLLFLWLQSRRRYRRLVGTYAAMRKQLSGMRTAVADKNENAMHFLQLALESVMKFEQMKQLVQMKLEAGENERLRKMMKDPALLDNFKEKCLRRFDVAFLRLYPAFVKEVNALLREDAQLVLPETEFMNNDLRLLAFLRIGITDSAQIAAILGVSVNTVYCYRTKLRNRAIDRNNFEKQIAETEI